MQEKHMQIKRGDIYCADLGENCGSEQCGTRPVLVIQNNVGNKYSPTVIVAPLTSSNRKHKLPTHCVIKGMVKMTSTVLLEQVRAIDKTRICGKRIAHLSDEQMNDVDKALSISVGLE